MERKHRCARCLLWNLVWLCLSCAASKTAVVPEREGMTDPSVIQKSDSTPKRVGTTGRTVSVSFTQGLKGEQKGVFHTYGVPDRAVRLNFGVTRWIYCRLKRPLMIEFDMDGMILGMIDVGHSCPQFVTDREMEDE